MADANQTPLHTQLVEISRDYLGPAADRFIDRQITTHIGKKPQEINSDDLLKLIVWIKLAFALLTHDNSLVEEYTNRLSTLTKQKPAKVEGS